MLCFVWCPCISSLLFVANMFGLLHFIQFSSCRSEKVVIATKFPFSLLTAQICIFPLKALAALEEKSNTNINHLKDLEEAISWYNEALGFRIEGGHGKQVFLC